MPNVYTTYFGNLRNLPPTIVPVSIALKSPAWYKGLEYKKLAPTWEILRDWKQAYNEVAYVSAYWSQVLEPLNYQEILEELFALSGGKDVALVCYERSDDFCHRQIVGSWFEDFDTRVQEFYKY